MKNHATRYIFVLSLSSLLISCTAQSDKQKILRIDRPPAVAGKFYPSDSGELATMLTAFFDKAPETDIEDPLALIVPHAGYVFSGEVAAAAFKQLDRDREFKRIFIIGSSHTQFFNGASIYCQGDFITPLGKVKVDTLSSVLAAKNSFITDDPSPHQQEHSLEVQLPFLQYWLKHEFSIVPIIIGGDSEENCVKLAEILSPYFNEENLFVISTDLSHYPQYEQAQVSDNAIIEAMLKNSSSDFISIKKEYENRKTPGLVTSICGWTSVYTLLNITESFDGAKYHKILYKNSGDSPYGEKDRVVGYAAIAITCQSCKTKESGYTLTDEEKVLLLKIARNTLTDYLGENKMYEPDDKMLTASMLVPSGAFVTLKKEGNLRGCIGNFYSEEPLYKVIMAMAISAAVNDPRFPLVKIDEVPELEIEISVLTPMKKINSIDEIEMGKHGIYIKKGERGGTFLPQVATETGWSREEFLGHCARDKAFIGWDGWKSAEIYTYEALVFSEQELRSLLK